MATYIRWKSIPNKWTLKEATEIGTFAILKMNTQERAELAQFLHNQFNLRANTFVRANSIPYAFTKIGQDYYKEITVDGHPLSIASRMGIELDDNVVVYNGRYRTLNPALAEKSNPQNALISYIILHQDFFRAKSSTVTGWREIGKKENMRLFGTVERTRRVQYIDENGKRRYRYETFDVPKYEMAEAERRAFWSVYEEARKTPWISINDYSSDSQREFARVWMKGNFNHTDFESALKAVEEILDKRPRFLREKAVGLNPDDDPFMSRRVPEYEEDKDTGSDYEW